MRGEILIFGALALASVGRADVTYTVAPATDTTRLSVTVEFDVKPGTTKVQIPNWAPGSYSYSDYYRGIKDFKVEDGSVAKLGANENNFTWVLSAEMAGKVKISYTAPLSFAEGIGHYSGPATYVYLIGRKEEKTVLKFNFAKPTKVAVGLDPIKENVSYKAGTYDILADNPVTFGDYIEDTYTVNGVKHFIAYRGAARKDVDRAYTKNTCQFISKMQADFFGGTPYHRYVWHFSVNDRRDGAGGLEHLSSTQIGLSSGVGHGAVGVLSHEFFHLWNVKRIRSSVLGPFDYTTLPQTGALWWLEGVTDYFSHTLLARYGFWTKEDLYKDVISNMTAVRRRKDRFEVGPYEASYRVRDAANGRGNSNGYLVSYYDTGWIAGMCLDVELLDATNGEYSLDDVEHALWEMCKDSKPGFEEREIRNQLVKFGGLGVGYFYDKIILKAGELPVEGQLAKLGLEIVDSTEMVPGIGVGLRPSIEDKALRTVGDLPATSVLKSTDLITKINGVATTVKNLQLALEKVNKTLAIGKDVEVMVTRAGAPMTLTVKVTGTERKFQRVVEKVGATPRQKKLRALFEAKKRK